MAKMSQKSFLVAFMLLPYFSTVYNTHVHKNQLNIGAILENRNGIKPTSLIKAFNTAIKDINKSNEYNFKFIPILEVINNGMYDTMVKTCSLLENNVVAIFGPLLEDNSNIVQSITDFKEIPHIEFRWDVHPLNAAHVNIHPYPGALTKTYLDIIKLWEWKNFVVLYENVESLQRIGEILKHFDPTKHKIIVRQLKGEYRDILKELWRSRATHFVLDCTIDILPEVLTKAQQVGLMTNKEHYIITNPNLHTIDLTQYQYGETNITGIRFLNPDDERLGKVAIQIHEMIEGQEYIAGWKLLLEEALMYDAVRTFAKAVKEAPPIELPTNISCHNDKLFPLGMSIISYMKNVNYNGLSGKIKFDTSGVRTNYALDIMELNEGGMTKIGIWNANLFNPLVIARAPPADDFADIKNRTFKVIITMTEPYGMKKQSLETLYGNDQYEGFAVDLIHELSKMRGFNYTLVEKDSAVGKLDNATGEWDGILGDIRAGRADLAVTDLSITSERREAVDFSAPFMTLGISILYQKPQKAPPSFFSFADPFAWEVWRLLMVACVGISFILFIVGRISPTEWENPYPCIEEPEYLVNQLDLRNCSWFVTGSIMQQGSEIELKSIGSRMVAGMWWFFTLLMVSSYTANLAAFLTTESPDPHFTNLNELINNAEQKGITYGAKLGGSTANFFRDKAPTKKVYEKAWKFMQENEDTVMFKDPKDGVRKAATDRYAFFMESSSIAYEIQRQCNLHQVNGVLDEKGYGIAMKKNATFRNSLSTAILQLQSSGTIEEIRKKWWEQSRGGGQCGDKASEAEAKPLFPINVGGVFGVTLAGTGLAIVCAMMETFSYALKKSIKTKRPLCTVLKEEVKFYFSFRKMVKPVTHGSSLEGSPSSTFQSDEKNLFDFVNRKQTSFDTLDSYTNSNKSKKSKNKLK